MDRTGLSRATVSSVIGELAGRGLISERRVPAPRGIGRPVARVTLNRAAGLAIGVDIGVSHVAVAVGDLSRSVLVERWTSLPRGHRATEGVGLVLASIEEALEEASADPDQLVGAAISIAAPVAPDSSRLLVPGVLPGWNGSELTEQVAQRWGIPVAMENDANLGALGESVFCGVDDEPILYVKVASRIGLGITLGSTLHRGHDGYAGEFGHVTVDPAGATCWCGRRGCLELYAGGDGLLRALADCRPRIASVDDLIRLAHRGDAQVLAAVAAGARALAGALANVALVLNPSSILLGGELAALGDLLAGPIRDELQNIPFGRPVRVATSALGERASLLGALALVLSESTRFEDLSREGPAEATTA
ncbi:transcriptional regulator [Flexivirga endophytica]|uniref:Transcriptional regulator n=1 Tax=Flexivirga endophytica TaxID=1849103 RepID=A0A916WTI4_9MICO|nr:ROK family protein [Flexivirga endophytica]GGB31396.1 transcriptional regulator [Flexivirga endophytica]GHB52358.1 transcriptional regulator [Flexivirga endophytica]